MHANAMVKHLHNGGTSVLVDCLPEGLPAIIYWGRHLGVQRQEHLDAAGIAAAPQRVSGSVDIPARLTVLPQESFGWLGTPGMSGHRDYQYVSAAFETTSIEAGASWLCVEASDSTSGLALKTEINIGASGLLKQRMTVTNLSPDAYCLEDLHCTFPLPESAAEILDTTGRHLKERSAQRSPFSIGAHVRQSRRGRPGADATLLMAAGTPAFGFQRGLVHAIHPAWSGNHRLLAERSNTHAPYLAGGELLLPGEILLGKNESYTTPWIVGSWGEGLNELSARFHQELRNRPQHPSRPRPVTLNTWEAVYFDHNLDTLKALADRASQVGVERYVLDDGWFTGRRDDTAGLGDWTVDPTKWPEGLDPLIDHVTGLGMEFGLWVEPEMVNPDSDLGRNHPEWILSNHGRMPVPARQQQVLNLANPAAYDYVFNSLTTLLDRYAISYLKWDHNRDLLEAADPQTGRASIHRNVLALYRLMAELKDRHPGLEIEACASGGARVDLGILDYTDRVWTSDCIDPTERLDIQKYTGLLVPPEMLGAHIGAPISHSTGRHASLDFQAITAMFGDLGIEWDIAALSGTDLEMLSQWVGEYKRLRPLLHTGRMVHADLADPTLDVRGVVSPNQDSAVYAFSQRSTSLRHPVGRVVFPGLDQAGNYEIKLSPLCSPLKHAGMSALAWTHESTPLPGAVLCNVGVQAPVLLPEQAVLIEVSRVRSANERTGLGPSESLNDHGD
ncbi:MAG TPA: alpha-galactosidase [Arthrobacter sp.]|nr:alpha-galactosidase [Arthrobacter sp.]